MRYAETKRVLPTVGSMKMWLPVLMLAAFCFGSPVMTRADSISGTVTNASGAKLAYCSVSILDQGNDGVAFVATGADGTYVATDLPPGTYYVLVDGPSGGGYVSQWYSNVAKRGYGIPTQATAVTVAAGVPQSNIDFGLEPGGTVAGVVQYEGGSPASGNMVNVLDDQDNTLGVSVVDGEGRFSVDRLPEGPAYVGVQPEWGSEYVPVWHTNVIASAYTVPSEATPIQVTPGGTNGGLFFSLPVGGAVSGIYTNEDDGLVPDGWTTVSLYDENGDYVSGYGFTGDGSYLITGILPGTYYVGGSPPYGNGYVGQWYDGVLSAGWSVPPHATPIHVSLGSSTTNANFAFSRAGAISGTVTGEGGAPLFDFSVDVYDSQGISVGFEYTDEGGRYTVGDLPRGDYFVRTGSWSSDYISEWYDDIRGDSSSAPEGATPVVVTSGVTNWGVDFSLSRGAIICGNVYGATGQPLPGVDVRVYDRTGYTLGTVATDTNGFYSVGGLDTDSYFLRTDVPSRLNHVDVWYEDVPVRGWDISRGATWVDARDGVTLSNVWFSLNEGASIRGRITDGGGSPLSGIAVEAYDPRNALLKTDTSDSNGHYSVGGLPPGNVSLRTDTPSTMNYVDQWYPNRTVNGWYAPQGAQWFDVAGTSVVSGVDFELHSGAQISGRVRDQGGSPLQYGSVSARGPDGNQEATANFNMEGEYTLRGLPAGWYGVRTHNWSWPSRQDQWHQNVPAVGYTTPDGVTWLEVTATTRVSRVDFALPPGGRISGTVTNASGTPLVDIAVDVYDHRSRYVQAGWTDGQGSYEVQGLPPGTFYARTRAEPGTGYADEWYGGASVTDGFYATNSSPVIVGNGERVTGIDFGLSRSTVVESGRISGRIVDGDGNPIQSAHVSVHDSGGLHEAYGFTDAMGDYELSVPGGRWYVQAEGDWLSDERPTWYGNVPVEGSGVPPNATPVDVSAGSTATNIDVTLPGGIPVEGFVRDSNGVGIHNAMVDVYDVGTNLVDYASTDARGGYRVAVRSGTYYIKAAAPYGSRYLDRWYAATSDCSSTAPIPPCASPVVVEEGSEGGSVDVMLPLGAVLEGSVSDASIGTLPGLSVAVYDSDAGFVEGTTTDGRGMFSLAVTSGTYFVLATVPPGSAYPSEWYDDVPGDASSIPAGAVAVPVVEGTTNSSLYFLFGGGVTQGTIAGWISDWKGLPIGDISVDVYDSTMKSVGSAPSSSNGRYTVTDLAPGEYRVRTLASESHFIDEWYDDVLVQGAGLPNGTAAVTVEGGADYR